MTEDHLVSREEIAWAKEDTAYADYYDLGEVTTHTLIGEGGEVHVFWHNSARPHYLYLGGYGISVPHGEQPRADSSDSELTLHGGQYHSAFRLLQGPAGTLAFELVEPRPGWGHSHNFGGRGAFPYWRSSLPVPANFPVVAFVEGAKDRLPSQQPITVCTDRHRLEITFEGKKHEIRIPD